MKLKISIVPIEAKAPDWRLYIIARLSDLLTNDMKVKSFSIILDESSPIVVYPKE